MPVAIRNPRVVVGVTVGAESLLPPKLHRMFTVSEYRDQDFLLVLPASTLTALLLTEMGAAVVPSGFTVSA
jgi:hypothetical protein